MTNLAQFPAHRTRTQPEQLLPGDWFITRGPHSSGPGSWVSWVAQEAPVDHGGSVGLAVRAMPLVAPDGSWPYGDELSREIQWVPLANVETVCAMPVERPVEPA